MSVDISKLNNALLIICGIVVFLITLLIFFVVLYRNRHNYFMQEQELAEARNRQALLQAQLEIQEHTFTQISQEIHDNIGQVLSLVRLNLNTLGEGANEEKLVTTDELLGQAIQDLRHLSHSLNTEFIKRAGLTEAIHKLLNSLERSGQFSTSFTTTADGFALGEDESLVLYRMVQEAINNTIKHARANHVSIAMTGKDTLESIIITDNGRGFDPSTASTGLGISSLMERGRLVNAQTTIASEPGKGTTVTIRLQGKGEKGLGLRDQGSGVVKTTKE